MFWADLGLPTGRRPVCVLTRDAAIDVLQAVTCAPVTHAIRGIQSEVEVGTDEGLPETSVIACDSVVTIPKSALDAEPVGRLGLPKRVELDQGLRSVLDIGY